MVVVLEQEERAYRERFGAIHDRLRSRLKRVHGDGLIPIAVKFHRQPDDGATQREADQVEAELLAGGIRVKRRSHVSTLFFAEGVPAAIERLGRSVRVEQIYLDEPVPVVSSDASDLVPYTQADITAWALEPPVLGITQQIGYVERIQAVALRLATVRSPICLLSVATAEATKPARVSRTRACVSPARTPSTTRRWCKQRGLRCRSQRLSWK
jgi:hypothetical protein